MIKKLAFLIAAGVCSIGCTQSDESMDTTLSGDPILLAVNPGVNRAEVVWNPNDDSVVYTEIYAGDELLTTAYFNRGESEVSRYVAVPSKGDYSFHVVNIKEDDSRSASSNLVVASIFDESWDEAEVVPCGIDEINFDSDMGGVITWADTDYLIGNTVFYTDLNGNSYSLYTSIEDGMSYFPEAEYLTEFTYISHYAPAENAIDDYMSTSSEAKTFNVVQDENGNFVLTVKSIEKMVPYFSRSNVHILLETGTYDITTEMTASEIFPDPFDVFGNGTMCHSLFCAMGDNSIYDFGGSTITVETGAMNARNANFNHVRFVGNDNIMRNLTMQDVGDEEDYPKNSCSNVRMDGRRNIVDNFDVFSTGSIPYGYGELFGKDGSSNTISMSKHSCVNMLGEYNLIKNSKFTHHGYGHVMHTQAGYWAKVQNCEFYAKTGSTNWVLADTRSKNDAGSNGWAKAYDVNYMSCFGYPVRRDDSMCLSEDCLRTYSTGDTVMDGEFYDDRYTGGFWATDCKVYNSRSGIAMALGGGVLVQEGALESNNPPVWWTGGEGVDGEIYTALPTEATGRHFAQRIEAYGCDVGFSTSTNCKILDCKGDAKYGPVLFMAYDTTSGVTAEIEVVPFKLDDVSDQGYPSVNGSQLVAYVRGSGHTVTLTRGSNSDPEYGFWDEYNAEYVNNTKDRMYIKLGGDNTKHGSMAYDEDYYNQTGYLIPADDNDQCKSSTLYIETEYSIKIDQSATGNTITAPSTAQIYYETSFDSTYGEIYREVETSESSVGGNTISRISL